tara:strand:- start:2075 stop:2407 length:333 start_codon:yes stop_codon:yes gene_type:complete
MSDTDNDWEDFKYHLDKDFSGLEVPLDFIKRIMTNMVVNPAVKVSNLEDQDLLNQKMLSCFFHAIRKTGVTVVNGDEYEDINTCILSMMNVIELGNEEAKQIERFERGIK